MVLLPSQEPTMPDLPPADPGDVLDAMAHALRHRRDGKRTQDYAALAAYAAAEHMLDALRRAGFVIVRRPAAPDHTAPIS